MVTATVEVDVRPSFRVAQIDGRFGLPPTKRTGHTFAVDLPDLGEDWKIGAIVGPSGSGKSTVAAEAYKTDLYAGGDWPHDAAMIDGFPEEIADTNSIFETLTAVGFGTAPDWKKPYRVLSNGQKFRADLARGLMTDRPLMAIDEMTSLLDRTTAFACCAAAAKAIRSGRIKRKLVAVTCHYDVVEPLECDWVLDMASQQLARGSLRRPQINIDVVRCSRDAWDLFKHHHYLDHGLHSSSRCYLATWDGRPVAFCAMLHSFGYAGYLRVTRVVTLPDYQGLGIGVRLMEHCCRERVANGAKRVTVTGTHPAVVRHCEKSKLWRLVDLKLTGNKKQGKAPEHNRPAVVSSGRPVVTFQYVGGAST